MPADELMCPKCKGHRFSMESEDEVDSNGYYKSWEECFQCGYKLNIINQKVEDEYYEGAST